MWWGCVVPLDLAPSSKIPAGLLGPRYLRYRPANQFLPSRGYKNLKKLKDREKIKIKKGCAWRRWLYLLRMRCDRFRRGSPTLAFRLYFSLASLCHLPFKKFGMGLKQGRGRCQSVSQVMVMIRVGEWEEIACSTYLMISLCSTTRFNSFTTRGPTHTDGWMDG